MSTLKQLVDETTNIKNELITCHTNLKTNLIGKGVEVLETDKIVDLINKIDGIKLGKKWASGQISQTFDPTNKYRVIQSNIKFDFTPTIFIAYFSNRNYPEPFALFIKDVYALTSGSSNTLKVFNKSNMYNDGMYIDNTGFKVMVHTSSYTVETSGSVFNWIAIE